VVEDRRERLAGWRRDEAGRWWRRCPVCLRELPETAFYLSQHRRGACITCRRARRSTTIHEGDSHD